MSIMVERINSILELVKIILEFEDDDDAAYKLPMTLLTRIHIQIKELDAAHESIKNHKDIESKDISKYHTAGAEISDALSAIGASFQLPAGAEPHIKGYNDEFESALASKEYDDFNNHALNAREHLAMALSSIEQYLKKVI